MEFSSKERYPSGSYGLISVLPIRTRRLSLRLFEPADADALYALHWDQRVARYAGGVKTKAESSESLKRVIDRTSSSGFGPLALEEKNSGAVIGWCGIQIMPGTDLYEVIYALQVAQWGKGLASEAVDGYSLPSVSAKGSRYRRDLCDSISAERQESIRP